MSSVNTRGQIVNDALALAGRSTELKQACNGWLNYGLRDLGLTFRFPELRKIGTTQQLAQGSNSAALPADFGAGMEKSGMIFGPDNRPLNEINYEEFANSRGFPIANSTGRPQRYIVDQNADLFRFDNTADQAYSFTPTYFQTPPQVDPSPSYDSSPIWIDNDMLAVHMLIWWIYVFTKDDREDKQHQLVEQMALKWERNTVKLGGTSRILPSPSRFKNTTYTGFGGFNGP